MFVSSQPTKLFSQHHIFFTLKPEWAREYLSRPTDGQQKRLEFCIINQ